MDSGETMEERKKGQDFILLHWLFRNIFNRTSRKDGLSSRDRAGIQALPHSKELTVWEGRADR